jgi:transketolase
MLDTDAARKVAETAKRLRAGAVTVRHRVIGLGVGHHELRKYGTPKEHHNAHGLDDRGISSSLDAFFGDASDLPY